MILLNQVNFKDMKLTNKTRDNLIEALSTHLDTRDKRFMFLKIAFPTLVSRIQLEGTAENCAYNFYEEFDKQQMLGSLIACVNSYFHTDLYLE